MGTRRVLSLVVPALLAAGLPTRAASALVPNAPIAVTTTADVVDTGDGLTSLREAVTLANQQAGPDEIVLTAADYPLTICDGTAAQEDANLSGDLDALDLAGLTITGSGGTSITQGCGTGVDGERIIDASGSLSVTRVRFEGGYVADGTAIRVGQDPSLHLDHVAIESLVPVGPLPAPLTKASSVLVKGNSATTGDVTLTDVSIATDYSGGLFVDDHGGPVNLEHVGITAPHRSAKHTLSIWSSGNPAVHLDRADVRNVAVDEAGMGTPMGAVMSWSKNTVIENSAFVGIGGVMSVIAAPGSLTLANSFVFPNTAGLAQPVADPSTGVFAPALHLSNSVIWHGGTWAGVVTGAEGHPSDIRSSTIAMNPGRGVIAEGEVSIQDSTIEGQGQAGISLSQDADMSIDHSTVLGGQAGLLGEATTSHPSTVVVGDSIVAGAVGSTCLDPTSVGLTVTSTGGNFFGDQTCGGNPTSDIADGGDPQLATFPTLEVPAPFSTDPLELPVRIPLASSPVRDLIPTAAISCTGVDERGVTRPQGPGCDAGAVEAEPTRSGFVGVGPTRITDTRTPWVPPGWPASQPMHGGDELVLPIAGRFGVPADATAVVLNVTTTEAFTGLSYLTGWPTGLPKPVASFTNLQTGVNLANTTTVRLGVDGAASLWLNTGQTDVVVDLLGYYAASAPNGFASVTPTRALDTRTAGGPLVVGGTRNLAIAGAVGGVPANASAVIVNLTTTQSSSGDAYLQAWPKGGTLPASSILNPSVGANVANLAVVPIGSGGSISLALGGPPGATSHLVVDVVGFIGPTGGLRFTPMNPQRLSDSRVDGVGMPYTPGQKRFPTIAGTGNVPTAAAAFTGTLTATQTTSSDGWARLKASDAPPTGTSNINYKPPANVANHLIAAIGADHAVEVLNWAATAHLIIDATGYYTPTP